MTRLALATALLLASTAAHAGDVFNFSVGGHSIHIEQLRDCYEASCLSVSIPGVYEYGTKRARKPAPKSEPAAPVATVAPTPAAAVASLEPANGTPPAVVASAPVAPVQENSRAPAPAAGLAAPLVASAPSAPTNDAPVAMAAPSPMGVWLTEENEGKVRIEACGSNLCGYSINEKTGQNGDKVLVNMKPMGAKWSGRIHDPKGGSTYDSTIALKGGDRLRVQGCAFGGLMCGGQTWTRVN